MGSGGAAVTREPLRWQTHFGRWVTDVTPGGLARQLRAAGAPVSESAVYKWVAGSHVPRPDVALRIVEISGGEITLGELYGTRHRFSDSRLELCEPSVRAVGA